MNKRLVRAAAAAAKEEEEISPGLIYRHVRYEREDRSEHGHRTCQEPIR